MIDVIFLGSFIIPFYEHIHPWWWCSCRPLSVVVITDLASNPLSQYGVSEATQQTPLVKYSDPWNSPRSQGTPSETGPAQWEDPCLASYYPPDVRVLFASCCSGPQRASPSPIAWTLCGTGQSHLFTNVSCISWEWWTCRESACSQASWLTTVTSSLSRVLSLTQTAQGQLNKPQVSRKPPGFEMLVCSSTSYPTHFTREFLRMFSLSFR